MEKKARRQSMQEGKRGGKLNSCKRNWPTLTSCKINNNVGNHNEGGKGAINYKWWNPQKEMKEHTNVSSFVQGTYKLSEYAEWRDLAARVSAILKVGDKAMKAV